MRKSPDKYRFMTLNMYQVRFILLITVLFSSFHTRAAIYSADSVEAINNTLMEMVSKRDPRRVLLIMPLEGFLARPVDPEFYVKDKKYFPALQRAEKNAKLSRKAYLEELILTEYENELSDPFIPQFIDNIQAKNIPMLVFTTNCAGSFNDISYLEVWSWAYLKNKNIDISRSPIGTEQFVFNELHTKVKGSYPTYYKGLLSANSWDRKNSVQSVLATLLITKLKSLPDVVYVIDKSESFIKSLELQFKSLRRDIQIEGFVFNPLLEPRDDLSVKRVAIFWNDLIKKLNKVSRTEKNTDEDDPYEQ